MKLIYYRPANLIKIFFFKTLSIFPLFLILLSSTLYAEDGYRLWLRYDLVSDSSKLSAYKEDIKGIIFQGSSETISAAKKELKNGLNGLLGVNVPCDNSAIQENCIIVGTPEGSPIIASLNISEKLKSIGNEGFIIIRYHRNQNNCLVIAANKDIGLFYGVFHFLQLIQTQQSISNLDIVSIPKIKIRVLNHWDNLNRTVEHGYAGESIWDWHRLPGYIDPRYIDYARANASIGINGTVLTNVNANSLVLTEEYLVKVQALANVFRTYGIKVYLTAGFSSPVEIGGLKTADPLDPAVKEWWKAKINEIYQYIPDFGGFLVKANSEGQPDPQNYGRTHADGANMMAEALAPHGGIVMWRAFVYDNNVPDDRAKQAYNEFKPLDGKFLSNVLIQVKNGAIDFQPREPFHPLFGAMPQTPLMMEFQITKEYLGFATHLVYLGTLFKETLESDTYAKGKGSTIAKVIDGTLDDHKLTGMAGVANIGSDINWCGHPFGQADWYIFGRLAWNPEVTAERIADDWIRLTFSNKESTIAPIKNIMMASREITVDYMTPVGLHHIMRWSHHYGPGPWIKNKQRADWTAVYYHKADSTGIGFDRTSTGSNAISQYFPEVQQKFSNLQTCPEKFLLWFHHVKWNYVMKSGRSLWDEICYKYYTGVDSVKWMQKTWDSLEGQIDDERFKEVQMLLTMQEKEAEIWRNSCILYFQTFSKMPIPNRFEKPERPLDYYMNLNYHFVPGN